MNRGLIKTAILFVTLSILLGCKGAPVPPEVREAELQEHGLWKAGAEIFAPEEYSKYKRALRDGQLHLLSQSQRLVWFRDYESVRTEFLNVLAEGKKIDEKVWEQKRVMCNNVADQIAFSQDRIETLRRLASLINEGRLSSRALTKAELLLAEARTLNERGECTEAEKKLKGLSSYTEQAEDAMLPILSRYADNGKISRWRQWVNETVEISKRNQTYSIVVSKLDRKLVLYKNGSPYKIYEIGLGTNGSKDKLYAGDKATPEGKYRIIKKVPGSHYHKALLINYPNDDDRRQYAIAKKKGLIPRRVGIGGLIEIHGGGKHGMTFGCVAMEDHHIDELFRIVDVGTPVTIVGAIEYENSVSSAMKKL